MKFKQILVRFHMKFGKISVCQFAHTFNELKPLTQSVLDEIMPVYHWLNQSVRVVV